MIKNEKKEVNKYSNLFIFFSAVVLIMLGQGIIIPFLVGLIAKDPISSGFIVAAFSIGGLIFSPLVGDYTNRIQIKNILQASLILYFISLAITFFVMDYFVPLFIVRFISGMLMATVFGSVETYISKSQKKENQSTIFLFISFANLVGMVVGPLVGAFMFGNTYKIITVLFLLALLTFLIVFFIRKDLVLLPLAPKESNEEFSFKTKVINPLVNIYYEFKEMMKSPKIFYSLIGFIIFGFIITSFETFGVYWVIETYWNRVKGLNIINLSFELFALVIVSLFYLLIINPKLLQKFGAFKMIIASAFVGAVSFGLFLTSPPIYFLIITMAIAIVSIAVLSNAIVYYISTSATNSGFVLGLKNSALSIGSIVGPLVAGFVYKLHPYLYMMSIPITLGIFVFFGITLLKNKK